MDAQYRQIDIDATGKEAVATAFENQVAYCRSSAAEITASVCEGLYGLLDSDRGGMMMERVRRWAGPPLADALPLRVAGGLHALHLSGDEPDLAPLYTRKRVSDVADLLAEVIERHEAVLMPWLDSPPQTNEVARSASFIAAMLWLADCGLPATFAPFEIGSSAGANLMIRRFGYNLGGVHFGRRTPVIDLSPEWRGEAPPDCEITLRRPVGCDIAPIDLTDPAEQSRLKAYVWPEFSERLMRIDRVIASAAESPPGLVQADAADFVDAQVAAPRHSKETLVLMHSVMWQYLPEDTKARITGAMEAAGAKATKDAPIAWISVEANRDTHQHECRVRYWPGGEEEVHLANAHPHGAWIEWLV
ncbi:DUF2332 domain-containing protein [Pseudoblastomonas halimionae]|uniref:DUF2332 family protein n=1 Tax=Alteriqipengyuania halimionae TaxID=1926630 RepID=A0A6I4U6B3_9SPHN|nr:DUF2332 domain-containing protein [Alteriqipengyuania halimionae]MXP09971.1 DUF2332 family protein [Alteriqipengyuania halimionae]